MEFMFAAVIVFLVFIIILSKLPMAAIVIGLLFLWLLGAHSRR